MPGEQEPMRLAAGAGATDPNGMLVVVVAVGGCGETGGRERRERRWRSGLILPWRGPAAVKFVLTPCSR